MIIRGAGTVSAIKKTVSAIRKNKKVSAIKKNLPPHILGLGSNRALPVVGFDGNSLQIGNGDKMGLWFQLYVEWAERK